MARNYYVSGTAARKYEYGNAVPARDPREEREALRRERQALKRQRAEQARIQRDVRRRENAKANRRNAVAISWAYVMFISVSAAAIGFAAYVMITTQATLSNTNRQIASLRSEIATMKANNDAREKEVTGSVDLNEIKEKAIKELGMNYVAESQIMYYSIEKDNFMDQYNSIPQ